MAQFELIMGGAAVRRAATKTVTRRFVIVGEDLNAKCFRSNSKYEWKILLTGSQRENISSRYPLLHFSTIR
jgi:hypothetical protein